MRAWIDLLARACLGGGVPFLVWFVNGVLLGVGRWCLVRGCGQQHGAPSVPGSAREALEMVRAGFAWLADADLASVPAVVQAECLRELEHARSVQAVAHANVLGAFGASAGYEDDGCRSPRTWLIWQTRITPRGAEGVGPVTDLARPRHRDRLLPQRVADLGVGAQPALPPHRG